MRTGFIFDRNRCVACGACKAGCFIENGWPLNVREVFAESDVLSSATVTVNLSLACNHCETAECMTGCPSSCFSRDELTGAVIIDDKKCIGCKYCTWNCPYDAPKFDNVRQTIIKCNFCVGRLTEGYSPACALACPTGALGFGEIEANSQLNALPWFPDKGLNPAIRFTGNSAPEQLKIISGNIFDEDISNVPASKFMAGDKWSLAVFSFISTLAVSFVAASLIKGVFPGILILAPLLVIASISSLFHLGKWRRAWRAVNNFRTSPLSREILLFIAFSCTSLSATVFSIPFLMPVSSVLGLIFLFTIDRVYLFSDNRKQVALHSGQTFMSSLLIISFVTGMKIPFIFIAVIRLAPAFYLLSSREGSGIMPLIRFLRMALILIAGAGFLSGRPVSGAQLLALLLAGELLDRLLFYADFNPANIKTTIKNHKTIARDEKK